MQPRHCNRLRESSSYWNTYQELIFLQSSRMQIGVSSKSSTKKGVVEQVRVHLPANPLILKNPVPHNQGSWLVLMDWDTIKITWMIPGRVCSQRVRVSFVVHAMRNVRQIVEKRPWNDHTHVDKVWKLIESFRPENSGFIFLQITSLQMN